MEINKKGFSLIETLVVCVIVGILAAASIPVYIGYVNNQKQVTVDNLAETAAASANALLRRTGTAPTPTGIQTPNAAPLFLYFNSTNYKVEILSATQIKVTDLKKTSITKTLNFN